jgi:hypothetical protein
MKVELTSAANYLTDLLRQHYKDPSEFFMTQFRDALVCVMTRTYKGYWYPNNPTKGCQIRTIQNDMKGIDPIIQEAGHYAYISDHTLSVVFKDELVMYIDPHKVECRINMGPTIIIYDNSVSNPAYTSNKYDDQPWISPNQKPNNMFDSFVERFFKHNPQKK